MLKKIKFDNILAILLIAVAGFWLKICSNITTDEYTSQFSTPQDIPRVLGIAIIVLSVMLLIKNIFFNQTEEKTVSIDKKKVLLVLAMVVLCFVYTKVIEIIGYIIATIIFLGIMFILYGVKNKVVIGVLTIIVPIALYALFALALKVPLP